MEITKRLIEEIAKDHYTKVSLKRARKCKYYVPDAKWHSESPTNCKDCFYNEFQNHELDYHYRLQKNQIDKVWKMLLAYFGNDLENVIGEVKYDY